MTKLLKIMLVMGFFILGFSALGFSQENITISTYYPSPMGVYRVLKLDPGGQPGTCQQGEMYFSSAAPNRLYICISANNWRPLLIISDIPTPPELWSTSGGGDIHKALGGNVGIGTDSPDTLLTVSGGGTALHVINGNAFFEQDVGIGTSPSGTYDLEVNGSIQADNYHSADGSPGITTVINVVTADGADADTEPDPCSIDVENGLVTDTDCP